MEGKSSNGNAHGDAGPAVEQAPPSQTPRVKVYKMQNQAWEELGIGDIEVTEEDGHAIFNVQDEETGEEILNSSTEYGCSYSRQQTTLILWSDRDNNDFSFSFQHEYWCTNVWEAICKAKGVSSDTEEIVVDDSGAQSDSCLSAGDHDETRLDAEAIQAAIPQLPPPDMSNLERWQELFDELDEVKQNAISTNDREVRDLVTIQVDSIVEQILDKEKRYINVLLDTFEQCEDFEDLPSLHRCYSIMSRMFGMCSNSLYEMLFEDDVLLNVIGMLEYDPARENRVKHREFLLQKAKFKQVVEIKNEELVREIHRCYRVQYIKDVIFSGTLNDSMNQALQTYVYCSSVEVCKALSEDRELLSELLKLLAETHVPATEYRDRVMMLKELIVLAKNLKLDQEKERDNNEPSLYKTLMDLGLFGLFEHWMSHPLVDVKRAALNILLIYQQNDADLIRDAILRPKTLGTKSLLAVTAEAFLSEETTALIPQIVLAIKYLIDVESLEAKTDKTKLLQLFYDEAIGLIMKPLEWDVSGSTNIIQHEKINHSLCLLAFFIPIHTYHAKNYVMRNGILQMALKHMKCGKNVIVLSALRLLRTVVGLKNEFYIRHLIKFGLFQSLVELLVENGPKYNLLNSSILELLKFVEHENMKSLVAHFAEVHGDALKPLTYASAVQDLLKRHLQNTEVIVDEGNSVWTEDADEARTRRDTTMDLQEEDYFDSLDDKDISEDAATTDTKDEAEPVPAPAPFVPFRKRLVPYDFDDDDDDEIFALATKSSKTGKE